MSSVKAEKPLGNTPIEYTLNKVWNIIKQSPNVIVLTDINGNIEYVNDRFTEITGYEKEEVIGKNPKILKSGEMAVKQYKGLWERITSGGVWRGEFHNKKKNGDYYWAQASISPIKDEYGKITNYLSIQQDITELKYAKEKIESQEEFLRKIIDTSPNPIFVKNIEGKYLLANKALGDIYNEFPENIVGRTNKDFIPNNEEINKIIEYEKEVINQLKEKFIPEESITDKEGIKRWFQTVKVPIISDNGKCDKVLTVATDITTIKKTQEMLEVSQNRLSLIFNNTSDLIFLLKVEDDNFKVITANQSYYNTTELKEDEVIGKYLMEIIPKNSSTPIINKCREVLRSRKQIRFEDYATFKGKSIYLETTLVPVFNNEGICTHILGVDHDITIHKEIDDLKSDLINTVSHEIRTPLASILGFTELLLERELSPQKVEKYINIVNNETKRLANLMSDFLDIQRMESGKQVLSKTKINIVKVLEDTIEFFSQNGEHKIVFSKKANKINVLGEKEKIIQLITNLLSNAIKYSPNNERIIIDLKIIKNKVLVSITDSGIGIPEKDIPNLFLKFYRVDNSDHRKIGGTGLGLAICKEIVNSHHGSIGVKSKEGIGSTFYFTLPIFKEADES